MCQRLAVLGVQLVVPEDGIVKPFFLRKTQQGFDLRADIEFVDAAVERGQKGNNRQLLDEGTVARLRQAQPRLYRMKVGGASRPNLRRRYGRRGRRGINTVQGAGQAANNSSAA